MPRQHDEWNEWNRSRLEAYVGTAETLRVEFKSMRSLLFHDKQNRNAKIQEAAKDVAAMANEQGGTIIYGIEEAKIDEARYAERLEDGFRPGDGVSREWFLQFIRDRVHPPLPDIDAREVPLNDLPPGDPDRRFALVVLVPQSIGVARQTDDLFFWRRDAQGLHRMTVQEIEDVRYRAIHPDLGLSLVAQRIENYNNTELRATCQFRIENPSPATASFAVITLGLARPSTANPSEAAGWRWLDSTDDWKTLRYVLASGSSVYWSPITPGFTAAIEPLTVVTWYLRDTDRVRPRALGLVRLDHKGGSRVYWLRLHLYSPDPSRQMRVELCEEGSPPDMVNEVQVPGIFRLPQLR